VINGIDDVPPPMVRIARTMGARGVKLYRHVIAPAAMPSVLAGLKQGWAFAWLSLLAGELLVVVPDHPSIGATLQKTRELSDTVGVLASMTTIFLVGVLVDAAFNAADRRMRRRRGLVAEEKAAVGASRVKPRTGDLASRAEPRADRLASGRGTAGASAGASAGAGAGWRDYVSPALVGAVGLASLGGIVFMAYADATPPPAPQAAGVSEAEATQIPPGPTLVPAPVPAPADRNLVLIDVSASMGEQAEPGTTWLQATTRAVAAETGSAPEATEMGIWVTGSQFQDGRDWWQLLAVGPLGERVGPTTRRELIQSNLGQMGAMPDDRLGLYNAVLAAFRTMTGTYQPGRDNAVTIIIDGGNDDPIGVTLEDLVVTLGNEYDPTRPVRVNIINYGDKVDHEALTRIANATRGDVYDAASPQQAQELFRAATSRHA
jgi:hypothetical protein